MKKFMLALIALTSTLVGTVSANECCEEGLYVGAIGGVNFLHANHAHGIKTGYMGGFVLGYKLLNNFRVEGELAYRRNRVKLDSYYDAQGAVETYSAMANAYYDFDFDMGYDITPYVGAGIGYAHNRFIVSHRGDGCFSGKDRFAYQAMAGVNYKLCEKTYAGLEYRYFALANAKHFPLKSPQDHTVAVSLKRYF